MKQRFLCLAMAFAVAGCEAFSTAHVDGNNADPSELEGVQPQTCVEVTVYRDRDEDGSGNPAVMDTVCKGDKPTPGYVANMNDCNDDAFSIRPGAPEFCDNVDNDCNKLVDDTTKSWYYDGDGDGHGDPASELPGACKGLAKNYVAVGDDCNDSSADQNKDSVKDGFPIHPGVKEDCDGVDSNCDGNTDKDIESTFYTDLDLDGRGDAAKPQKACTPAKGIVVSKDDCNDDPSKDGAKMFPGNPEVCDNIDNDCNKLVDDGDKVKKIYFKDDDGDGYGDPGKKVEACDVPVGATTTNTDCNDDPNANPHGKKIHPGAIETCNNVDENCDGQTDNGALLSFYFDNDGDGHGGAGNPHFACTAPKGFYPDKTDCDDGDPNVYPGAPELCDGKFNACAGPEKENDGLCNDKSLFTKDICLGAKGCKHEDEKLLMTCSNPDQFKESDGYSCGVAYYYGDALADKKIVMTFEKAAASPNMADVCAELQQGKTLHVSVFVQIDFDPKFVWVATSFMKLIDSFTNAEIKKQKPGNVVVGHSIRLDRTLKDIPDCQ